MLIAKRVTTRAARYCPNEATTVFYPAAQARARVKCIPCCVACFKKLSAHKQGW